MRRVTYGAACSLDGFIARSDGGIDWLRFSSDVREIMATYWARIDTILMGRKTWEVAAASGGGGAGDHSIRSYVFSRTLTDDPAPGVTLVREDAGEFVRRLKAERGKEICLMSGGQLAGSLFAAGVIDEVRINVHPVLLGSGAPLFFDSGRQVDLTLFECRPIKNDCVMMSYRVKRARKAARARSARA